MLKLASTFALVLPLLVAGCAGSPYAESKKFDRLREYSGADAGFAVMSVGHVKSSPFTVSSVVLRAKGTDDRGGFNYAPKAFFGSTKDFDTPESEGTVVTLKLPPGTYEIGAASGGWGAGTYRFTAGTPILPPMVFTVEQGETVYLGRFVVGYNGRRESPPANLEISDLLASDLAIAASKEKAIRIDTAKSYIPSAERRKQ